MKENKKNIEMTDGLLLAYINGELEIGLSDSVESWIESSNENKTRYESLRKTWDLTGTLDPIPVDVNTDEAWGQVFQKLPKKEEKVIPINKNRGRRNIWMGIAAAIVIAIGSVSILQFLNGESSSITRVADNGILVDELKDGSVVTLNDNASIIYPKVFAENERRVELHGEAFFDIERNEEKPFIIDLPNNGSVKVLGTSFNIKADKDSDITEVFVKTGKVEFGVPGNKIILVAGEKGVMNRSTGEVKEVEVEEFINMKTTYWVDEKINFEGEPLVDVVEILETVFEENIILNCNSTRTFPTRTKHKGESLFEILDVISNIHSLDLSVEEKQGEKTYRIDCND